jgi:TrmH family RNA methyltransferase
MALSKAHIQRYRQLHHARGRRESGRFLIEGPTLMLEALKEGWPLTEVLVEREFASDASGKDLARKLNLASVPWENCSATELARVAETVTPQGAVALAPLTPPRRNLNDSTPPEIILICQSVSDPGNLGTLLRTADWFGVSSVILGEGSADPFSPKVVRASAGSVFRVETREIEDLEEFIRNESSNGRQCFAAVMQGDLLPPDLPHSGRRGLVVGHEMRGVSAEVAAVCSGTVRIPGSGRVESLNLAVAAGILIYALTIL